MKNTNVVLQFIKVISLLILSIVTCILIFSVWVLVDIEVFPWAFCAILFALIMIGVIVLASKAAVQLLGVGAYTSTLISSLFYYFFIMIFTGATYSEISQIGYIIAILIATLFYLLALGGLYVSGIHKNADVANQEIEQTKALDVTLQLMNILESIKQCASFIEKTNYTSIIEAFNDMSERLKASTPFGRIAKPVIINAENQINLKLSAIHEDVILLKTTKENEKKCKAITEVIAEVKTLIINREKMIIQ